MKTFLIYSVMWLLIGGCVQDPPAAEEKPDIASVVSAEGCNGVELEQITYTVGEKGVTLISAGEQCYGFQIEAGMGMVIMPTLPDGTELRLSLNGQHLEMEKLDFGMYGKQISEAGNYILAVDVPDNSSATQLLVVINSVR